MRNPIPRRVVTWSRNASESTNRASASHAAPQALVHAKTMARSGWLLARGCHENPRQQGRRTTSSAHSCDLRIGRECRCEPFASLKYRQMPSKWIISVSAATGVTTGHVMRARRPATGADCTKPSGQECSRLAAWECKYSRERFFNADPWRKVSKHLQLACATSEAPVDAVHHRAACRKQRQVPQTAARHSPRLREPIRKRIRAFRELPGHAADTQLH